MKQSIQLWQCSDHTKALEMIVRDPFIIGVNSEQTDLRMVEFPFFNDKGRQLGEVDVIFGQSESKRLYIVEYKTHDNQKLRKKAKEQLFIGREGLKSQFGWDVTHMLYVHGPNFQTYQLIDDYITFCNNQDYIRERFE